MGSEMCIRDRLEVVMPLAHGALQSCGDIDHGGFPLESLAQIERLVPSVVVGSAAAGGFSTATSHDNEAAVQEALGLVEKLVEPAAALSFGSRQNRRGDRLAWHGLRGSARRIDENLSAVKKKVGKNRMRKCSQPNPPPKTASFSLNQRTCRSSAFSISESLSLAGMSFPR